MVSGRTDAGVHALAQVSHFDSTRSLDTEKIVGALNFHLQPHPIVIHEAEEMPDDWHCRFSARSRSYCYRIINRKTPLAIDLHRAWWITAPLDADLMHQAARHLIGTHDFSSFRDSDCQAKSPTKTIKEISVRRVEDEIFIEVCAPSFLHHMVRNITGSLVNVGNNKWSVDDFIKVRDAKDRKAGGVTAPACGLYFVKVEY